MKTKIAIVVLAALLLAGCQPVPSYRSQVLTNVETLPSGIIQDAHEVNWYADRMNESFSEWLRSGVWSKTYPVNYEPLAWVAEPQQEAYPSPASTEMCALWTGAIPGRSAAAITHTFIFRLQDSNDQYATAADVDDLVDALASGLRRNGWGGAIRLSESQYAWQAPIAEEDIPVVPLESTERSGFEQMTSDALAYRVQFASRGDGYISLYVTSPCTVVTPKELDTLRDSTASQEIELIKNDRDKSPLVNPQG